MPAPMANPTMAVATTHRVFATDAQVLFVPTGTLIQGKATIAKFGKEASALGELVESEEVGNPS
jgi:hypothetical protein